MGGDESNQESKDHLSPEERSELMSRINSTETQPEQLTRSLLHRAGYRFRKNVKELPGTPDVVLPKHNTVVFVHGCYWHRHDCRKGNSVPSNNRNFWIRKFERNIQRDRENYDNLGSMGWEVIIVWECNLKKDPEDEISRLINKMKRKR